MDRKINRSIKCYPLLHGTTADLLFYIAIDTLFLTTVKHFSTEQIVLITTISSWVGVFLRIPLLWIIKKLGNTASIRAGTISMLLSALLITFAPTFSLVLLGRCLRLVGNTANEIAAVVTLENNLEQAGRSEEFISKRAMGSVYYSVITLVISFVATPLFQINAYLPMYLCILGAATGMVISFFVADYSPHNYPAHTPKKEKVKVKFAPFAALTLLLHCVVYSFAALSITDCKLCIQDNIGEYLTLENTVTVIGAIYFLSRICRVIGNTIYTRFYRKFQLKTGLVVIGLFISGFLLILLGGWVSVVPLKVLLMGLGYFVEMLVIDSFRYYVMQIFILFSPRKEHQDMFAYMSFAKSLGSAVLSMGASLLLVEGTMMSVMVLYLATAVLGLFLMWILYRILLKLSPINSAKTI